MIKVIEKIKSFCEWRMNFVRIHPFYSAWLSFVKGIIIGGLIVYWYLDKDWIFRYLTKSL